MASTKRIMISNVRCTFPKLFVAEEYMGKTNYSIGLIIPADHPALKAIEAAALEIAEARYPGKGDGMVRRFKQSKTTWPLKALDDGGFQLTPKRKVEQGAPTVLDQKKQNLPASSGLPYAGCWVNCSVDLFCYTKSGGGITAYLNGVQLVREDAPLGGGATAASCRDDFEVIEDAGGMESDTSDLV